MKPQFYISIITLAASVVVVSAEERSPKASDNEKQTSEQTIPTTNPDEPVARVNGKMITRADLEEAKQAMVMHYARQGRPTPNATEAGFDREVLEEIIRREVVLAEGLKHEIPDLDNKVKKQIYQIETQVGGHEALLEGIRSANMTEVDLNEQIRNQIVWQETMKNISDPDIEITLTESKSFYERNKTKFRQPEQVQASHILIRVPKDASEEIKKEKRLQLDAAITRIKNGEKFSDVAKDVSEDPTSGANGGDLGSFPRGMMVPEFEAAAFSLEQDKLSDIIITQFGYHVLVVTGKTEARELAFDEVKEKIASHLKTQKSAEVAKKYIDDLRNSANVEFYLK